MSTTISSYSDTTASMQADPEARPCDEASVSFAQAFPISEARCATYPVDGEWVPDHEHPVVPTQMMAVCRGCPARQECLLWALAGKEAGYWAGTTSADRAQMITEGTSGILAAERIQGRVRTGHSGIAQHPAGEGSYRRYRKGCRCLECQTANAHQRAIERARAAARHAARHAA